MNRYISLFLASAMTCPLAAQCLDGNLGSDLGLTDDDTAVVSLAGNSFYFPGAAAPVTSIEVDSNGRVFPPGLGISSDYNESLTDLFADPQIAVIWTDIQPDSGFADGVYAYVDATKFVITWKDCVYYNQSTQFTAQLVGYFADSSFDIYHDSRVPSTSMIVGTSDGGTGVAGVDLTSSFGTSTSYSSSPMVYEQFGTYDLVDQLYHFTPIAGGYDVAGPCGTPPPLPPEIPKEGDTNLPAATPADSELYFVAGLDIEGRIDSAGLRFDYGSGQTSVSMQTTAYNPGSVEGTWIPAPNKEHPLICQMYVRLSDKTTSTGETVTRLEQVSDWSWMKHSFFSTNSGCPDFGGYFLGLGCTDTYGAGLNASRSYSGPPWELNPFTGDWNATGSHWDIGFPPTPADGSSSFATHPDESIFRAAIVQNADIGNPGAAYYGMAYYIHQWEPENVRNNNMSHRTVDLTSGSVSSDQIFGSVINRWTGARVVDEANYVGGVARDGRFYVASVVTPLSDGWYRYEYAVHNRDNHGRMSTFSIPICSSATVRATGMKDVDTESGNQWSVNLGGGSLDFDAPSGNAQPWNTIFNFWFETDAAPADDTITLVQANPQANASSVVDVTTDTPTAMTNINLGGGCPENIEFDVKGHGGVTDLLLEVSDARPSAAAVVHISFFTDSVIDLNSLGAVYGPPGCLFLNPGTNLPITIDGFGDGSATLTPPGLPPSGDWYMQAVALTVAPPGPAIFGYAEISDRIRVRFGTGVNTCN